jgi:UDP-glucose 4-epimerase
MQVGGTGRIGAYTARYLVEQGFSPVIFDLYPNTDLIKDITNKIRIVRGDTTDLGQLIKTAKENEIKHIIDLVWLLNPKDETKYVNYAKVTIDGFVNVLEAARIMDIESLAFCSSKGVYGRVSEEYGPPNYKLVAEDLAWPDFQGKGPAILTIYGRTKFLCESIGLGYHEDYGLDFKATRFGHNYGAEGTTSRSEICTTLIENALQGVSTKIPSGGDAKMDYTYYKDIAQGLVKACFAKNPKSRIYNIANGVGLSLKDWAITLKLIFPNAQIEVGPGTNIGLQIPMVMDIARAREELGYEPQYTLEEGIKDTINMYNLLNLKPILHS